MKLSLCFGLAGAVLLPLMYESYANISRTMALLILGCWAVFVGVKSSGLAKKAAFLCVSAALAYSIGMGLIFYVIIHNAAVSMLEKSSKYFYLTLQEQLMFWLYAFLLLLVSYVIMLFVWGFKYVIHHIKSNNEKAADYIANAFDESGDKQ